MRCGAADVRIVYRRRQDDMTALVSEIESAVMEGIELMTLQAPKAIEKDADGNCTALVVQPQMIGPYDKAGRPSPLDANKSAFAVPCDVVLIAVGQDIVSKPFEDFGMPANRGVFKAGLDTAVAEMPGVFVGGDCQTAPSTAIRAIAAGKVAARNIDAYLGYDHKLPCEAEAPAPGRITAPRPAGPISPNALPISASTTLSTSKTPSRWRRPCRRRAAACAVITLAAECWKEAVIDEEHYYGR